MVIVLLLTLSLAELLVVPVERLPAKQVLALPG